jgi:hypothetical protein
LTSGGAGGESLQQPVTIPHLIGITMTNSQDKLSDLQRRYDALQKSIDTLKAAGVDESAIAPLREQVAEIKLEIKTSGGSVGLAM